MEANRLYNWAIIVAVVIGYFYCSEDYYNRKVKELETSSTSVIKTIPSPKKTIKITYEEWEKVSKKMLTKIYIPWENKDLIERTINNFISAGEIYFNEAIEEINIEDKYNKRKETE